jgi:hypothetical protein
MLEVLNNLTHSERTASWFSELLRHQTEMVLAACGRQIEGSDLLGSRGGLS